MRKRNNLSGHLKKILPWSGMSHVMMADEGMGKVLHSYILMVRKSHIMEWLPGEVMDTLVEARDQGEIPPVIGAPEDSEFAIAWNKFHHEDDLDDADASLLIKPFMRMFESELISCLRDASRNALKVSRVDLQSDVSFEGFNRNVRRAMLRFNESLETGTSRPWYAPHVEYAGDGSRRAYAMNQFKPALSICAPGKTRFMSSDIKYEVNREEEECQP